jgi:hypothetical protein
MQFSIFPSLPWAFDPFPLAWLPPAYALPEAAQIGSLPGVL